jgi:hypothetical protein
MRKKSARSSRLLLTKLQVSTRPKGTDLSLDWQGITPGRAHRVSESPCLHEVGGLFGVWIVHA